MFVRYTAASLSSVYGRQVVGNSKNHSSTNASGAHTHLLYDYQFIILYWLFTVYFHVSHEKKSVSLSKYPVHLKPRTCSHLYSLSSLTATARHNQGSCCAGWREPGCCGAGEEWSGAWGGARVAGVSGWQGLVTANTSLSCLASTTLTGYMCSSYAVYLWIDCFIW